ncbi:MAG: AAA family ATPase, partial [Clostridiales bacterium]|nr:AAA family ATPase [Clostridiales bacterium]
AKKDLQTAATEVTTQATQAALAAQTTQTAQAAPASINASGNKEIPFDTKKSPLSGPDQKKISDIILKMVDERLLIKDMDETGKNMIYLPSLYYSELGTARRIKEIISTPSRFSGIDADSLIINIQKECNITYDEVQIEAIKKAAVTKFMVLTGGPGTGKTTTTLAIIRVLQKAGGSVLLAAPTGRAAKRMTETTGMEAKTIHRLLEYRPPAGYKRTAENPLLCDVLIIDETSMVDIVLMYNLLKAIPDTTIVLLIGDSDQLPSVGPGNVLKDIIDSGCTEVVRLTRIFRQAMGSNIILNAHRINKGEFPILKSGSDSDFFYIEQEDPEKVVEEIKNLCLHRLPEYFKLDPLNDIQVLCPMQRGHTGAQNLNLVLQEALNPTDISIKYGTTIFRQNDKVMQIKNNYDKNVFNGDIGIIIFIDREDRSLVIRFDNTNVEYDSTELDEVILAYATTVHKSQGSEYKVVVAPFTTQHFMMLQRNLLYTCVTRAKKAIVLIGTKKAIAIAVHNNKSLKRNTRLSDRLSTI